MKRIVCSLLLAVAFASVALAHGTLKLALEALANPHAERVLVVSHRGDWRNAPENSIPAMLSCVAMGVDMVEIDLHKTKDGHLVLMHDKKVDRTTNGKGAVADLTLAEIKSLRLRNGMGRVTTVQVPTMEEVFAALKGKVLINVDKGYDYFDEVHAAAERLGMVDQIVIKCGGRLAKIQQEKGDVIKRSIFMPIVQIDADDAEMVLDEFLAIHPVAIECCFRKADARVERLLKKVADAGVKVWINTLWPSLNGGHDDDRAILDADPDGAWDWTLQHHAQFLQTDRPAPLIQYLKSQGRH
ncbi:MAG: glycerophosphodiester phosphodiesterase family protein [Bacteroidales bacterium]|nr:glycerophosphodiester phosphodiesterase family protein [Bacteroidales bacterium]